MIHDGFGHELPYQGKSNDWITPKWIIDAFGTGFFYLDPCASLTQPWPCARKSYTIEQDGLKQPWYGGKVWLNPPYGPHTAKWIMRMAEYKGGGIALIFARVETKLWHDYIFPTATGFLFPNKRIQFVRPDGTIPKSSSGAPSALISWGYECHNKLVEIVDSGLIQGVFLERRA